MWLGHDISFWISIFGAIVFKLITSEAYSIKQTLTTVIAALFFAWVFTDATLNYLEINESTYKVPVAAVWALMGESVSRMFLRLESFKEIVELWNAIRGKTK